MSGLDGLGYRDATVVVVGCASGIGEATARILGDLGARVHAVSVRRPTVPHETFHAIDLIESGRYPFDKMHTLSFPLEQAEDAIHALAGHVPGVNPIHLAIVPGAPRVTLPC